jgi:hypothetical protein
MKPTEPASEVTKAVLDALSRSFLKMHKCLLDDAKKDYEAAHGPIASVNVYFQLVIDDPHFAWLRKISSLVALLDEATSLRRPASEEEAAGLIAESRAILSFADGDDDFNLRFSGGLLRNAEAAGHHQDAVGTLESI